MTVWRLQRNQDEFESELYDIEHTENVNPFGEFLIAKIDDVSGNKFDQYARGTRVDAFDIEDDNPELSVSSGETHTISSGDTESYSYASVDGTLQVEGTLQVTGTQREQFSGYVVERRELEQQGADALEIEAYTFDQFLRRDTVSNDQTGKTISAALEDIIKTDTPVTWNAANVTVEDDVTLTQSYQGEQVENAIRNLASKSTNEEFGVNSDVEFFFTPRTTSTAPRDINDSQWLNYDIPERGKESINEVRVWYDNDTKQVTVRDGGDQQELQENLGTNNPVSLVKEAARPDLTDITDARAAGEEILNERATTLTGTVTSFGLNGAEPGDTIHITIESRGIDDDFRIVENTKRWGDDANQLTIVKKKGQQDDVLVRLSDAVQRQETADVDRAAVENIFTSTKWTAVVTPTVDVDGTTEDSAVVTNIARNLLRDGWGGDGNISVSNIVVGNDGSEPKRSNTSLGNQLDSQSASESFPDTTTVRYEATTNETDIREIGLEDANGDLIMRAVVPSTSFSAPVDIDVDLSVNDDTSIVKGVVTSTGQTTVRDIIADNSPALPTQYAYGSDGTAPTVGDTALGSEQAKVNFDEKLVQEADTNSEFTAITTIPSDVPLAVQNNQLELLQSSFFEECEDATIAVGGAGGVVAEPNASDAEAVELVETGDSVQNSWNIPYTIPDANVQWAFRLRAEDANEVPDINVFIDGDLVLGPGSPTNQDTYDWFGYRSESSGVDLSGNTTLEIEIDQQTANIDSLFVDCMTLSDDRYSYTLDNTTDSDDHLSGPELFPDLQETTFSTVTTNRGYDEMTVNQTWNDTSNNQFIRLSNDGGTTTSTTNNSATANATFASKGTELQTTVGLSRFGTRTTATPTSGFNGQTVGDHDMFGNFDSIRPSDIGTDTVEAIVKAGVLGGTTIREGGQLDSGDNLLSRVVFADIDVDNDQTIASNETVRFVNPD